tara:strand:- start:51 stop:509 length:459 start_codon:yes stop_codon:yes gene_type:complete
MKVQKRKAKKKVYYNENKMSILAKRKIYYEDNKESVSEKGKAWYEVNKEKAAIKYKTWCQANPEKRNASNAKRRAAKLQRTPNWISSAHLKEIETFYMLSKWYEKATGLKHHVDHIVPLQGDLVSGLHVPWNLQVITAAENCSKNNVYRESI